MLPAVTRFTTAAIAAIALAAASASPAAAWGKNEQNFLKGIAAAVIVHQIVKQSRKSQAAAPAPVPDPANPYPAPHPGHGHHTSITAMAFQEYSPQARRAIQQRLAAYGYYRGPIDGAWGRGTAAAVAAYARDVNASASLASRDGSVRLFNQLIA